MTLNTQIPVAVKPYMVFVITALGRVTANAGQHLSGPRIVDILPDGMGKRTVQPVAFIAHVIDGSLEHIRMVGAMGCMTVIAGIRFLVTEFGSIPPSESILVAATADIALLAFEQPFIIAGMRRMTGNTAVILVPYQMIMGGGHLFSDIIMTPETGFDTHRYTFSFMAVIATFCVRWVQDIADHCRPVAAMGAVTGGAVLHLFRKVGVFLLYRLERMTKLA